MKQILFSNNSWSGYCYWEEHDKRALKKIKELIRDIDRNGPDKGIGYPEPLKGDKAGWYSRHINDKDRLIYRVNESGVIEIYEVGTHYGDK
jgi:toxin YoeB